MQMPLDIDVASSGIIRMVMQMNELKTINEVCKMLGMTSRTIRYYEQCGLIRTIRESKTALRRLDDENIERLRKIRFLRKLSLTLDEIAVVIDSEAKATEMIHGKSAELKAEIRALIERIGLIEEVLAAAENGGNIYSVERKSGQPSDDTEKRRIAAECTNLLLERRFSELKPYLNSDMKMMPPDFFEAAWNAHIKPCGKFISVGEQSVDGNTVTNRLIFEKLGVIVKTEVCGEIVAGMVLQYFKATPHNDRPYRVH